MDGKQDMRQQCALTAQKANHILGRNKRNVASKAREVILPELVRSHLHPDVESSVQESHEPVRVHPEEGHKNDPRDGTPLQRRQAERAGAVQVGEERPSGRPASGLSVSKEGL